MLSKKTIPRITIKTKANFIIKDSSILNPGDSVTNEIKAFTAAKEVAVIDEIKHIIGAFRGIPEIQNFPWVSSSSSSGTSTTTDSDIYTMNFKSLKQTSFSLNGLFVAI